MPMYGVALIETCGLSGKPTMVERDLAVRSILRYCRDKRLGPVVAVELADELGLSIPGASRSHRPAQAVGADLSGVLWVTR